MEFVECEVWLVVNSAGEYDVAKSADDVHSLFSDNCDADQPTRTVKVTVRVPKPKAAEVVVTVGEEPGDVTAAA